jgi:ATP-dependent RNA helicase DeaD
LTTEDRVTGVSEAQAALERGRAVMLVTPPAVEQAEAVWQLLAAAAPAAGPTTLIVCADSDAAAAWADAAPAPFRAHAATGGGLGRATRLLTAHALDVLAGSPEDLQALATRSALKLDALSTVVLAWPEWLIATDRLPMLEQLLGEVREARRIVLAWDPRVLEDFLERYARRPHVMGDLPMGQDARPLAPVTAARYVVLPRARRTGALREVLDVLDRPRVIEWRRGTALTEQGDAVVCVDLPSRDELTMVATHGEPILLVAPSQLPYARSVAAPLTPLPLSTTRQRAHNEAEALRIRAAARIDAGGLEAELGLLEPLLERYDAAEVAAALLALGRQPPAVSDQPVPQAPSAAPPETWVKLFVNVGKKDRAGAKDLVGALTREIGLAREDIGRIEVREGFSLVSVAPHAADAAIRGLSRVAIRGRRIAARRERER